MTDDWEKSLSYVSHGIITYKENAKEIADMLGISRMRVIRLLEKLNGKTLCKSAFIMILEAG